MSMRDYAYVDYGLVLDNETIKHMYAKAISGQGEDEYDMGYELYNKGIVEYTGEFTGEARRIEDNGNDAWGDATVYSADVIYYVPLGKYPSLFEVNYKDMNEIVEEFKSKVGEYMPEGYDYRANIRHIIGTTFG